MDLPLEKRFKMMAQILRATHFEWRRAALAFCPDADPKELVMKFWEEVGHDTAAAYLKQLDPAKPLPKQMAENTVFSSLCMGEDARVVEGTDERECFVRHDGCPWYDWHQRLGLLEEDQAGCDQWFRTFTADINEKLGAAIKWETQKCLAAGDDHCLRRFWVE